MDDSQREGRIAELRAAAGFLTRLPVGKGALRPAILAQGAWAFPVVGAGVGLVAGVVFATVVMAGAPPMVAGFAAVLTSILLSGGLHEDGLADTIDGLAGGSDRAESLAIMRDSRIGAMGTLALVFSVGVRVAALAAVAAAVPNLAPLALIAAGALGRACLPPILRLEPKARADGLAVAAGTPSGEGAAAAIGIGVLAAALALAPISATAFALSVAGAAVGAAVMSNIATRRLGGVTGDVLGAVEQVAEAAALVALAAAVA